MFKKIIPGKRFQKDIWKKLKKQKSTKNKDKLAIILDGGGMASSYSVGVILALVKKFKLTEPDIAIGGSGSAGTLAYYTAKQYKSIGNIWLNLLSSKRFINLLRFWKIIDIDYLIDEVFKKQDPLKEENVRKSKIDFLISATNCETGKIEYISAKDTPCVFEALRATKAMPIAYGKRLFIGKKCYCDTHLSISTNLHISKAYKMGARKILVVKNGDKHTINDAFFKLWVYLQNSRFKKNYLKKATEEKKMTLPKNLKIFFINPESPLRVSTLNNDQKKLKEAVWQGFGETMQNKELVKFLS